MQQFQTLVPPFSSTIRTIFSDGNGSPNRAFGAQISFEAKPGVSYEDAAASIDKDKLAKLMCLDTLGYSAKDIEIITPEQYKSEFGGDEDG